MDQVRRSAIRLRERALTVELGNAGPASISLRPVRHGRAHEREEVVDAFAINGTKAIASNGSSRRLPSGQPPSASDSGGFHLDKTRRQSRAARMFESGVVREPSRRSTFQDMPPSGSQGCRKRRRG